MQTFREPARDITVAAEKDVVVVGAGPAGITAAICAARQGASTMLIDEHGYLGGMMTGGLMPSMNGFRNERPPDQLQTIKGIGQELIDRLIDAGGAVGRTAHGVMELRKGYAPYAVAYDPEIFKLVAVRMCREAGVELLLHTYAVDAITENNAVKGVIVQNKGGRQAIFARVVVDTADGDIAAAAGAPFEKAAHGPDTNSLRMTIMFRLAGVDTANMPPRSHGIPIHDSFVMWGGQAFRDGTDPKDLTEAEIEAREQTMAMVEEIKKRPGFEKAYLVQTADFIGVRETRRFLCEHKITDDEARNDVRFPDVIGISSNPAPRFNGARYFFEHEGFDMPYRCLVPLKVDNLLVAGKCISADQLPWQSARSQAPSLATGQAAGTAAALCAKLGVTPRKLDVAKLQESLLAQNVELRR